MRRSASPTSWKNEGRWMGLMFLVTMPQASVTTIGDASFVVIRFGDVKASAGIAAFFAIWKLTLVMAKGDCELSVDKPKLEMMLSAPDLREVAQVWPKVSRKGNTTVHYLFQCQWTTGVSVTCNVWGKTESTPVFAWTSWECNLTRQMVAQQNKPEHLLLFFS